MITQHFTIDDRILTCSGCGDRLTENRLEHQDGCEFTAGIRAAEREWLASRQQVLDEIRAELDDAFQFTEHDGSRHGYVTREWVQSLLAHHAASAAAAECERIAKLADERDASYDTAVPCGCHRPSCTATVRETHSFADLIRERP